MWTKKLFAYFWDVQLRRVWKYNGVDLKVPFLMLVLFSLKIIGPVLFADIYVVIMAKIESWAWSK